MDSFKKQAFLKKYPWLEKIISRENEELDNISIKRIDKNLLMSTPSTYFHDGSLGCTDVGEEISLILNRGEDIRKVISSGRSSSNYAYTPRRQWDGERVIDACNGIDNLNDHLDAITVTNWDHDDWQGGNEVKHSWEITIYLPKENIEKMIEDLTAQAEKELEQNIQSNSCGGE